MGDAIGLAQRAHEGGQDTIAKAVAGGWRASRRRWLRAIRRRRLGRLSARGAKTKCSACRAGENALRPTYMKNARVRVVVARRRCRPAGKPVRRMSSRRYFDMLMSRWLDDEVIATKPATDDKSESASQGGRSATCSISRQHGHAVRRIDGQIVQVSRHARRQAVCNTSRATASRPSTSSTAATWASASTATPIWCKCMTEGLGSRGRAHPRNPADLRRRHRARTAAGKHLRGRRQGGSAQGHGKADHQKIG